MPPFTPGQRWISNAEPELGLGIITEVTPRQLSLDFPKVAQSRRYNRDNAPLSRLRFQPGDHIRSSEGQQHEVVAVQEVDGLYHYQVSTGAILVETHLDHSVALHQPLQRLLGGQVEAPLWYRLRHQALQTLHFIESTPLLGLSGARADLIPHQLYIAHEVAGRHAPRVLLADEVGLGKTIEAGLILQQQLFNGLASRVLILVPETLVHQWLVEMLRRFNLAFSVFDSRRCDSLDAEGIANPFATAQLVLTCPGFFARNPARHQQALDASWDLLIVDEAHHIEAPEDGGAPLPYEQLQAFSRAIAGVILLTATPDQMGAFSHFALLRLLDPARFHDFAEFQSQQARFSALAAHLDQLQARPAGDPALSRAGLAPTESVEGNLAQAEIKRLLDQQGTGRILFRNSRATLSGFPKRKPLPVALDCPADYPANPRALYPESDGCADNWLAQDPRVPWLLDFLQAHRRLKILLICAQRRTAQALEEYLRLRHGIRSAVFHEAMSVLERDRAAAWFAQAEGGAQILLCSEIGSEGRNFQFSHHLVLFDLPLNPDLLEQRIGRLDRIGQRHEVKLHIPYLRGTAHEILFRWYHEGLDAFNQVCNAGHLVYRDLGGELQQLLGQDATGNDFIRRTASLAASHRAQLATGKDKLLARNSHDPAISAQLVADIQALEAIHNPAPFLSTLFDTYGLEAEENSDGSWTVRPGEHMLMDGFPVVPDEGMTYTCRRELAVHREDIHFVNWRHPLVEQGIDLVLQADHGKTAVSLLKDKRFPSGTLLLEACFRLSLDCPRHWQPQRFLPSTVIRVLIDSHNRNLSKALSFDDFNKLLQPLEKHQVNAVIDAHRERILGLHAKAGKLAQSLVPAHTAAASRRMLDTLGGELKRLSALRGTNPTIREDELDYLQAQIRGLHQALQNPTLQLEALHLALTL